MFYYKIWFDDTDPLGLVLEKGDLKGVDRWIVYTGKPIETWPEGVTFYAEGEHIEDYLAGTSWVVISERARQALERCLIREIQFLPVAIKHKKLVIGQYWVINVLQVAEALDWKHTRWMYPERKYTDEYPLLNILRESFRWDVVKDLDAFLLSVKGKLERFIYISPRVKECLERSGASSGFKFIPIAVY